MTGQPSSRKSASVVCVVCGYTTDADEANERWAFRPVANQWMCEECWQDQRDFPEPDTLMRDSSERCPDCDSKTAELIVRSSGERLHLYCTNPECDRSRHL